MSDNKHTTRRRTSSLDEASRAMLYEGLNMSQLTIAFGKDHRILDELLHGVPSNGERNGSAIWKIIDVAPHLVKPVGNIEDHIKKMNPADLPKSLSREFWGAIKTRQEVEKASGDLWPTERVVGTIGSLMKQMKMSVRLMCDTVDMQAELSEKQRRIVKQLGDSMLEQLYTEVRESFQPKKDKDGKELPVSQEAEQIAGRMVKLLSLPNNVIDELLTLADTNPRVLMNGLSKAIQEDEDEL